MFSLRIVSTSHCQADPLPDLDARYSPFRSADVRKVPILRIFGATPAGQKTCMHVHGVFPYLCVPYDGTCPLDSYLRRFAASLDKAINVASNSQANHHHVFKISLISGIPMYGYHAEEQQFLKIYLYNPSSIRKAADLLLGGAVMNKAFQPHEAHIPFPLQLFIDYNLYGMNLINVAAVKFRRKDKEGDEKPRQGGSGLDVSGGSGGGDGVGGSWSSDGDSVSNTPSLARWDVNTMASDMLLPASVERESTCELEVDVVAADILNRRKVLDNMGSNPGLAALWEDERQRRRDVGAASQITPQDSQEHKNVEASESERELFQRFADIVQRQTALSRSESEESAVSMEDVTLTPDDTCLPASQVENHSQPVSDSPELSSQDTTIVESDDEGGGREEGPVISLQSIQRVVSFSQSFSQPTASPPEGEVADQSLVEVLAALAEESSGPGSQRGAAHASLVEDGDSVVGLQVPLPPDARSLQQDEEDTLAMSQTLAHHSDLDLEGLDATWDESADEEDRGCVMDNDEREEEEADDDDDDDSEDDIPQLDGTSDEKPAGSKSSTARLEPGVEGQGGEGTAGGGEPGAQWPGPLTHTTGGASQTSEQAAPSRHPPQQLGAFPQQQRAGYYGHQVWGEAGGGAMMGYAGHNAPSMAGWTQSQTSYPTSPAYHRGNSYGYYPYPQRYPYNPAYRQAAPHTSPRPANFSPPPPRSPLSPSAYPRGSSAFPAGSSPQHYPPFLPPSPHTQPSTQAMGRRHSEGSIGPQAAWNYQPMGYSGDSNPSPGMSASPAYGPPHAASSESWTLPSPSSQAPSDGGQQPYPAFSKATGLADSNFNPGTTSCDSVRSSSSGSQTSEASHNSVATSVSKQQTTLQALLASPECSPLPPSPAASAHQTSGDASAPLAPRDRGFRLPEKRSSSFSGQSGGHSALSSLCSFVSSVDPTARTPTPNSDTPSSTPTSGPSPSVVGGGDEGGALSVTDSSMGPIKRQLMQPSPRPPTRSMSVDEASRPVPAVGQGGVRDPPLPSSQTVNAGRVGSQASTSSSGPSVLSTASRADRLGKQNRQKRLCLNVERLRRGSEDSSPATPTPCPAYTFTFHVPTPVYKRFKMRGRSVFPDRELADVKVVRMHPMDARRYSLLKIGRELVRIRRLSPRELPCSVSTKGACADKAVGDRGCQAPPTGERLSSLPAVSAANASKLAAPDSASIKAASPSPDNKATSLPADAKNSKSTTPASEDGPAAKKGSSRRLKGPKCRRSLTTVDGSCQTPGLARMETETGNGVEMGSPHLELQAGPEPARDQDSGMVAEGNGTDQSWQAMDRDCRPSVKVEYPAQPSTGWPSNQAWGQSSPSMPVERWGAGPWQGGGYPAWGPAARGQCQPYTGQSPGEGCEGSKQQYPYTSWAPSPAAFPTPSTAQSLPSVASSPSASKAGLESPTTYPFPPFARGPFPYGGAGQSLYPAPSPQSSYGGGPSPGYPCTKDGYSPGHQGPFLSPSQQGQYNPSVYPQPQPHNGGFYPYNQFSPTNSGQQPQASPSAMRVNQFPPSSNQQAHFSPPANLQGQFSPPSNLQGQFSSPPIPQGQFTGQSGQFSCQVDQFLPSTGQQTQFTTGQFSSPCNEPSQFSPANSAGQFSPLSQVSPQVTYPGHFSPPGTQPLQQFPVSHPASRPDTFPPYGEAESFCQSGQVNAPGTTAPTHSSGGTGPFLDATNEGNPFLRQGACQAGTRSVTDPVARSWDHDGRDAEPGRPRREDKSEGNDGSLDAYSAGREKDKSGLCPTTTNKSSKPTRTIPAKEDSEEDCFRKEQKKFRSQAPSKSSRGKKGPGSAVARRSAVQLWSDGDSESAEESEESSDDYRPASQSWRGRKRRGGRQGRGAIKRGKRASVDASPALASYSVLEKKGGRRGKAPKPGRAKKGQPLIEGIHYIVVGKFKGHKIMLVKVHRVKVNLHERVKVSEWQGKGERSRPKGQTRLLGPRCRRLARGSLASDPSFVQAEGSQNCGEDSDASTVVDGDCESVLRNAARGTEHSSVNDEVDRGTEHSAVNDEVDQCETESVEKDVSCQVKSKVNNMKCTNLFVKLNNILGGEKDKLTSLAKVTKCEKSQEVSEGTGKGAVEDSSMESESQDKERSSETSVEVKKETKKMAEEDTSESQHTDPLDRGPSPPAPCPPPPGSTPAAQARGEAPSDPVAMETSESRTQSPSAEPGKPPSDSPFVVSEHSQDADCSSLAPSPPGSASPVCPSPPLAASKSPDSNALRHASHLKSDTRKSDTRRVEAAESRQQSKASSSSSPAFCFPPVCEGQLQEFSSDSSDCHACFSDGRGHPSNQPPRRRKGKLRSTGKSVVKATDGDGDKWSEADRERVKKQKALTPNQRLGVAFLSTRSRRRRGRGGRAAGGGARVEGGGADASLDSLSLLHMATLVSLGGDHGNGNPAHPSSPPGGHGEGAGVEEKENHNGDADPHFEWTAFNFDFGDGTKPRQRGGQRSGEGGEGSYTYSEEKKLISGTSQELLDPHTYSVLLEESAGFDNVHPSHHTGSKGGATLAKRAAGPRKKAVKKKVTKSSSKTSKVLHSLQALHMATLASLGPPLPHASHRSYCDSVSDCNDLYEESLVRMSYTSPVPSDLSDLSPPLPLSPEQLSRCNGALEKKQRSFPGRVKVEEIRGTRAVRMSQLRAENAEVLHGQLPTPPPVPPPTTEPPVKADPAPAPPPWPPHPGMPDPAKLPPPAVPWSHPLHIVTDTIGGGAWKDRVIHDALTEKFQSRSTHLCDQTSPSLTLARAAHGATDKTPPLSLSAGASREDCSDASSGACAQRPAVTLSGDGADHKAADRAQPLLREHPASYPAAAQAQPLGLGERNALFSNSHQRKMDGYNSDRIPAPPTVYCPGLNNQAANYLNGHQSSSYRHGDKPLVYTAEGVSNRHLLTVSHNSQKEAGPLSPEGSGDSSRGRLPSRSFGGQGGHRSPMGSFGGQRSHRSPLGSHGGQGSHRSPLGSFGGQSHRSPLGSFEGQESHRTSLMSPRGQGSQRSSLMSFGDQGSHRSPLGSVEAQGSHRSPLGSVEGQGSHRSPLGSVEGQGSHRSPLGSVGGQGSHRSPFVSSGVQGSHKSAEGHGSRYLWHRSHSNPEGEGVNKSAPWPCGQVVKEGGLSRTEMVISQMFNLPSTCTPSGTQAKSPAGSDHSKSPSAYTKHRFADWPADRDSNGWRGPSSQERSFQKRSPHSYHGSGVQRSPASLSPARSTAFPFPQHPSPGMKASVRQDSALPSPGDRGRPPHYDRPPTDPTQATRSPSRYADRYSYVKRSPHSDKSKSPSAHYDVGKSPSALQDRYHSDSKSPSAHYNMGKSPSALQDRYHSDSRSPGAYYAGGLSHPGSVYDGCPKWQGKSPVPSSDVYSANARSPKGYSPRSYSYSYPPEKATPTSAPFNPSAAKYPSSSFSSSVFNGSGKSPNRSSVFDCAASSEGEGGKAVRMDAWLKQDRKRSVGDYLGEVIESTYAGAKQALPKQLDIGKSDSDVYSAAHLQGTAGRSEWRPDGKSSPRVPCCSSAKSPIQQGRESDRVGGDSDFALDLTASRKVRVAETLQSSAAASRAGVPQVRAVYGVASSVNTPSLSSAASVSRLKGGSLPCAPPCGNVVSTVSTATRPTWTSIKTDKFENITDDEDDDVIPASQDYSTSVYRYPGLRRLSSITTSWSPYSLPQPRPTLYPAYHQRLYSQASGCGDNSQVSSGRAGGGSSAGRGLGSGDQTGSHSFVSSYGSQWRDTPADASSTPATSIMSRFEPITDSEEEEDGGMKAGDPKYCGSRPVSAALSTAAYSSAALSTAAYSSAALSSAAYSSAALSTAAYSSAALSTAAYSSALYSSASYSSAYRQYSSAPCSNLRAAYPAPGALEEGRSRVTPPYLTPATSIHSPPTTDHLPSSLCYEAPRDREDMSHTSANTSVSLYSQSALPASSPLHSQKQAAHTLTPTLTSDPPTSAHEPSCAGGLCVAGCGGDDGDDSGPEDKGGRKKKKAGHVPASGSAPSPPPAPSGQGRGEDAHRDQRGSDGRDLDDRERRSGPMTGQERSRLVLCPRVAPPSRGEVEATAVSAGLSVEPMQPAFCSHPADLPERPRELGGRVLRIATTRIAHLEEVTVAEGAKGLHDWQSQRLSHNALLCSQPDPMASTFAQRLQKEPHLRAALIGDGPCVMTPVKPPPTRSSVMAWLLEKLAGLSPSGGKTPAPRSQGEGEGDTGPLDIDVPEEDSQGGTGRGSDDDDEDTLFTGLRDRRSQPSDDTVRRKHDSGSSAGEGSSTPKRQRLGELGPLLHSTPLRRPGNDLFPPTATPKQRALRRLSTNTETALRHSMLTPEARKESLEGDVSQIDAPTPRNTHGFKVTQQNLQDAKALHKHQYLTVLSMELHADSRGDLYPDPDVDAVRALFYGVFDDIPADKGRRDITGVIVVDPESFAPGKGPRSPRPSPSRTKGRRALLEDCGILDDLDVTYVRSEVDLLAEFTRLVKRLDPDIVVGFEIQQLSWGYLLHRAATLNVNLCADIARVKGSKRRSGFSAERDEWGADHSSEIHIEGRVVLNLWRILRHEVSLNVYSYENCAFHILHQRVPTFTFRSLNAWYAHRSHLHRWRVVHHYRSRVKGQLAMLDRLDIIGKTSEFARVFGIEFFDVLSRGSQYRVESMMLRLAKPLNFVPVSPSVQQRARQKAAECIPLNLEPQSRFYTEPVVVLDFQSLYPSIMIAHNYCFSTCLGRLDNLQQAQEGPFEFGCTSLKISPDTLKKLRKKVTVSPNGCVFVTSRVRRGVIPMMVEEILKTRLMVKKSMKDYKDDKMLHRMLDARQLGLKLIANVTYGYTGASFSGRMPCIEVADSIVRKARESLERAIQLVEGRAEWGARVVYGDTDSLFVLLPGRSKDEALVLGQQMADAVTATFPKPMKLKFEKVYLPCVLQTKKRYVGFSWETQDQVAPLFDAKGIETVRRDNCGVASKVLERCAKILFTTRDVSQVRAYLQRQLSKMMAGRVGLHDYVFAKEYRGMASYRPGACVPALEIAKKRLAADRRAEPRVGERVPYVIVHGPPGLPLIQLVRQPSELLVDSCLRINVAYYIARQVLPPLDRLLSLVGVSVAQWYSAMPKVVRVDPALPPGQDNKQGTISQYFATSDCLVCERQTKDAVCASCRRDPQVVAVTLASRSAAWESVHDKLSQVCRTCMGTQDPSQPCVSLDCPVLFRRHRAAHDLARAQHCRQAMDKALTW